VPDDTHSRSQRATEEEPRYAVDRLLDRAEGPRIVGVLDTLGRQVKPHEIAGALHGEDRKTLTVEQVREKVTEYLARPWEG
jgi:hypothetical protein